MISNDKMLKVNTNEKNITKPKKFEDLKVTTMTLVIHLEGEVDINPLFGLLKVTKIDIPIGKRITQKVKIPHIDNPGAILSLRYRGNIRGIVRSTSSKYFKNSITIDLATKTKNVSIKLSSSKIQMCGASSVEQGIEGANYVLLQILNIQENLDYMRENSREAEETLNYVINLTRGAKICRAIRIPENTSNSLSFEENNQMLQEVSSEESESTIKESESTITESESTITESSRMIQTPKDSKYRYQIDYLFVSSKVIRIRENENFKFPENVDLKIFLFLIRNIDEFEYHSDFKSELEWIRTVNQITTKKLGIKEVSKAMVNYNYDLGFKVDRFKLSTLMNCRNGFYARYHNAVEHNVTIELPYILPPDRQKMRKKNKTPCHTFLVYMSGLVTQSGPGEDLMKDAYYKFLKNIEEIKNEVSKNEVSKNEVSKNEVSKNEVSKNEVSKNEVSFNTSVKMS